MTWAILWRSKGGSHLVGTTSHPCRRVLFDTRQEARDYVRERFGYIASRPDLQGPPHFWKMPKPVKVTIAIEVAA